MKFKVGDVLFVDGDLYDVVGAVEYLNHNDQAKWIEYRLISKEEFSEHWLSYDQEYNEFSISKCVTYKDKSAYHLVDSGTEEVINVWGEVDVEPGDTASFQEYEDDTEELIISVENWDDQEEYSEGYYLDVDEIYLYDECYGSGYNSSNVRVGASSLKRSHRPITLVDVLGGFIVIATILLIGVATYFSEKEEYRETVTVVQLSIADYLQHSTEYVYKTSITADSEQKADVFVSNFSVEEAAMDIIISTGGNTEDIREDGVGEDYTISILSDEEYCLIYTSEDQEVLVQVSDRAYVYSSDEEPYHSRYHTRRFFRHHYYNYILCFMLLSCETDE